MVSAAARDAGDDAGHDQIVERIDGVRLEGVDLFGDAHRPQFRADTGADATGHQQPGRERSRLADERNRETGRNHCLRPEPLERRARVHRQHDPDREARGRNQRCRTETELEQMPKDLAAFVWWGERLDERAASEDRERPDRRQQADGAGADAIDQG